MAKTLNQALIARELEADGFIDQASFLQTRLWARQKEAFGWKARYFRVGLLEADGAAHLPGPAGASPAGASLDILVLLKVLKAGYTLAYVPHGPGLDAFRAFRSALQDNSVGGLEGGACAAGSGPEDGPLLAAVGKALRKALKIRLLALRFDLDWELFLPGQAKATGPGGTALAESKPAAGQTEAKTKPDHESEEEASPDSCPDPEVIRKRSRLKGLIKAAADIQPPDTVIVDLGPGEEAVLARMKPKTRYNARLAAKKGVALRQGTLEDLETWYGLYEETARRDRIGIHGKDYYRRLLEDNPADCVLLLAEHEGDTLAGIILLTHQTQATYLYGASSNIKRNLMPAYALQWEGMKIALGRGCKSWDLFGIPPSADPGHPMHGLYQFKTGFGGRIVHRFGTRDLVCSPFAYYAFRIYEGLRFWILRRLKKQFS